MFEQEEFKRDPPKPRAVWSMANENPPLMGENIPEATQSMSLEESVVMFGRLTEKESQETMTGKTVVISKKNGDVEKSNDNKPKPKIKQEDSKGESKEHDVEESTESKEHDVEESSESKEHDVEESTESKEHDVEESSESKEHVMRKEENIETTPEEHLEGKEEHNEEHTEEDVENKQIKSIDKHVGSEEEHVEKIKENVESKQEIKVEDYEEEHLENKEEIPDDPRKTMKTIPSEDVSAVINASGNQCNENDNEEKGKQNEVMMEQEEILAGVKEAWIVESSTLLDDVKSHDFSMDGNSNTQVPHIDNKSHDFSMDGNSNTQVPHIDNKSPVDSISIPDKQSESKSSLYQYESNQDESVPLQAKGVPANKIFHLLQKRNETENQITSVSKVINDYTLLNI